MISSFFSKTKPINYLVLLGFSLLLYVVVVYRKWSSDWTSPLLFSKIIGLLAFFGLIWGSGFLANKIKLTGTNSFAMLFFVLFTAAFNELLHWDSLLMANMFVMISASRVLQLKFEKATNTKIYEAALWVLVASIFHEWALLFMVPLLIGIYVYSAKMARNWTMPLAAMATFSLLLAAVVLTFEDTATVLDGYRFEWQIIAFQDFKTAFQLAIVLYVVLGLISIFVVLSKLRYRGIGRMVSLRLLAVYYFLGLCLMCFAKGMEHHAIFYSFFPASVFCANYVETIAKKKVKEGLLVALAIATLGMMVVSLWQ
ncbi:MAG: hypothetical protein HRT65_02885 [Flavobacteriaceae bacterium]|nr:hypothetical protein [Flavobacteriaceae bacterium]